MEEDSGGGVGNGTGTKELTPWQGGPGHNAGKQKETQPCSHWSCGKGQSSPPFQALGMGHGTTLSLKVRKSGVKPCPKFLT